MHNYEVIGRLTRNGKSHKDGDRIVLSAEDGAALASRGRVKPATETAKKAVEKVSTASE